MKSTNFEILRDSWPELASFSALTESHIPADPASALMKLRLFAENIDLIETVRSFYPEADKHPESSLSEGKVLQCI